MHNYITAKRSGDIIVCVYQDNIRKEIIISGINEYAEYLLDYKNEEVIGKSFFYILSPNVIDTITENIEHTNDNDLSNILIKINNFSLKDRHGITHEVRQKIFRVMTSNKNIINYEILMRDISISRKLEIFRNKSLSGMKYIIHPNLEIIDERSSKLEIQLILDFININRLDAMIGIIKLNSYCDNQSTHKLLKIIVNVLYQNIRNDDIVGYIAENSIFIILIKCNNHNGRKAMLRLYNTIDNNLKSSQSAKFSMAYLLLNGHTNYRKVLDKINISLSKLEKDAGNSIAEA